MIELPPGSLRRIMMLPMVPKEITGKQGNKVVVAL